MVEISRAIGELNNVALVTGFEAKVSVEIEDGMRVLEADLNALWIFVGLEEIRDFVVVIGVVKDVSGRES